MLEGIVGGWRVWVVGGLWEGGRRGNNCLHFIDDIEGFLDCEKDVLAVFESAQVEAMGLTVFVFDAVAQLIKTKSFPPRSNCCLPSNTVMRLYCGSKSSHLSGSVRFIPGKLICWWETCSGSFKPCADPSFDFVLRFATDAHSLLWTLLTCWEIMLLTLFAEYRDKIVQCGRERVDRDRMRNREWPLIWR
ncbi:LAFA_0B03290g1_1 [Lachancea sp. 'fantastica']|nr:LAFA_0B03290g1_1 [Lachancea sp. 'fantastica']